MDKLCANETFWDVTQSWQAEQPVFSKCFQNLVLTCLPCLTLWAMATMYLPCVVRRTTSLAGKRGWMFWAKQLSGSMMLILGVISIFLVISHMMESRDGDTPIAQLIAPCARTATMMLVLVVVTMETAKGINSSVVLFIFWLLVVIGDIVQLYCVILQQFQDTSDNLVAAAMFYLTFALDLLQLSLHSFSDKSVTISQDKTPENSSSLPAWLTYCWTNR
ncbi:hypothetical protein V1264_014965 [Littorina saxatilis]|uniref:ABC transporter TMD0 domain-containing protein n=1 Tax=Littorina saxatilis TaxID=31220 RepID=A0AAN9GFX7_9CAEN